MNISQLIEGLVAKNVMYGDLHIKNDSNNLIDVLKWLNTDIIHPLNNDQYYNDVNNLISNLEQDNNLKAKMIENIQQNNLFIEAPSFSEIDIRRLYQKSAKPNEDVLVKKETLQYLKDKLKVDLAFPIQDITLKKIFCTPIYIMKLYKLVSHIISARDLGPCKAIKLVVAYIRN